MWPLAVLGALALVMLAKAVKVVPAEQRVALLRLGKFMGIRGPGLIVVAPLLDRLVRYELGTQELRVSDAAGVDAVVRYRILDPEKTYRNCASLPDALGMSARTAIGQVTASRPGQAPTDVFTRQAVRDAMDGIAANFGVKVLEVELLPRG